MSPTIELEPQPRIDTLVRLADGGAEVRRTEYAGVAWLNGRPVASGMAFQPGPTAARGVVLPSFETQFFLPDSRPYTPEDAAGATLQVAVALRATGETGAVLGGIAEFTPDPSGRPLWIALRVAAHIRFPAGITYRVVALTPA